MRKEGSDVRKGCALLLNAGGISWGRQTSQRDFAARSVVVRRSRGADVEIEARYSPTIPSANLFFVALTSRSRSEADRAGSGSAMRCI
jgi:hypothetical protein